uniref:SWIM-type domain-containing protein n=1 Tax=Ananas comosus var. bracteatus TaxID=296719 RepID=A0A6V7QL01_ANACO|nr:unnamed protein product [Ananas comosus var. bracteatus]
MAQSTGDQVLDEKNNNEDTCEVINLDDSDEQIEVGVKVGSEDEAYDLYNQHALRKGFSIRKGNRRFIDGALRQREYVCSKAGFREFRDRSVKKINRIETRTGCNARIRFTITDGTWEVTLFNDDHNHEFASQEEKHNLRSGRRKRDTHIDSPVVTEGTKPGKAYMYLTKQLGRVKNVGSAKKNCLNYLQTTRKATIEAGDVQGIIDYFKYKQVEDPLFFYSVQVDQENRMTNFFWRDGRSKLDYDAFGDVVIFDTAYRIEKYNLICAPLVGINHHWRNVLFGCAFLLDETAESYIWLLETFLEAMGGRHPKSIFTDHDQAISKAIEIVLPESRHRLGLWNILVNAKKNLGGIYSNPNFISIFSICLDGCLDEIKFQSTWENMIKTFNLEENEWLNRLHETRANWCTAFGIDLFSAKMKSTQRSESTNSIFHQLLGTTLPPIKVIEFYELKSEEMRQVEQDENLLCNEGSFGNVFTHGILGHAASVYTRRLFEMFKEEFHEGLWMSCIEAGCEGSVVMYELNKSGEKKVLLVKFDKADSTIFCSCKLFETVGLFCSHALRVLLVNNVNEIPLHYIMHRWTKDARKRAIMSFSTESLSKEGKSARALRLSELNHIGHYVFDKGSLTARGERIVKERLIEALDLIEKEFGGLHLVENGNGKLVENNEISCSDVNVAGNDPLLRGRKGRITIRKRRKLCLLLLLKCHKSFLIRCFSHLQINCRKLDQFKCLISPVWYRCYRARFLFKHRNLVQLKCHPLPLLKCYSQPSFKCSSLVL